MKKSFFLYLLIIILLPGCFSDNDKLVNDLKENDTKKEYYNYIKNLDTDRSHYQDIEIIDLVNNKFLTLDENSTMDDIENLFGKSIDKDVYSNDDGDWNERIKYKYNLSILMKKDKIVAAEIELPSNYLFISKLKINGYESFKELITKLGKPYGVNNFGNNNEWMSMSWFISGKKVVFLGYQKDKYPNYLQYYF